MALTLKDDFRDRIERKKKDETLQDQVSFGEITEDNVNQLRKIHSAALPVPYNDLFYRDIMRCSDPNLCKFAYLNGTSIVGAICSRIEPIIPPTNARPQKITHKKGKNNDQGQRQVSDWLQPNPVCADRSSVGGKRIYIMTLAVLSTHRGRGIGRKLVRSILDYHRDMTTPPSPSGHEKGNELEKDNHGVSELSVKSVGRDEADKVRFLSQYPSLLMTTPLSLPDSSKRKISTILDQYRQTDFNVNSINSELSSVEEIMLHVHSSNEDAVRFYVDKLGFTRGELVRNYYRRIDPPHCYILRKRLV